MKLTAECLLAFAFIFVPSTLIPPTFTALQTVNIEILSFAGIKELRPYLKEDAKNVHEYDYYTFGFQHENRFHIIPLYELLRAVLAVDVFWLNIITSLDTSGTLINHEFADDRILHIHFSRDVPLKYVSFDEKIKHAAWIFSNSNIYEMIAQAYRNIKAGIGIKFDFLFEHLFIQARTEYFGGKVFIREIISFNKKRCQCDKIIVHHPGLAEYEKTCADEKNKKWTPFIEPSRYFSQRI